MKIELLTQNNKTGKVYDISDLVSNIAWETSMADQPGKLTFNFPDNGISVMYEGSPIQFKVDDVGVFFGFVFKRTRKKDKIVSVVAYDQLRYLKNKDTYVLQGATASSIFSKICQDVGLKYVVKHLSPYVLPSRVHDNKSLFEIINYGIDQTLINANQWFMIQDNFGTLEFVDVSYLKTNLFIGDQSLLSGYQLEKSIDDDTYNIIKLVKENKETGVRSIYIVKDSSTIAQWGKLQYFEKVDESANDAQIQLKGEQLLKLKNRVTTKFQVDCLGDLKIRAGSGIVVGIQDLTDEGLDVYKYYIVDTCVHSFENELHIMRLDLKVTI